MAPTEAATGTGRVLAILRSLAEHPDGATVAALAAEFGAPKSSVHRALAALVGAGFARQDEDSRYHLGYPFLRLAFGYQATHQPHTDVRALLQELAATFGETVHYGVLDGAQIIYQAKVSPAGHAYSMSSVVGGTNPAFRTGLGKALLMYDLTDLEQVRAFVAAHGPLQPRTEHTITDADTLDRVLSEGRRRGYALDLEENELGLSCIAFPLFLHSADRPTGAISISAVSRRTGAEALEAAAPRIRTMIIDHLGDVLPAVEQTPDRGDHPTR